MQADADPAQLQQQFAQLHLEQRQGILLGEIDSNWEAPQSWHQEQRNADLHFAGEPILSAVIQAQLYVPCVHLMRLHVCFN